MFNGTSLHQIAFYEGTEGNHLCKVTYKFKQPLRVAIIMFDIQNVVREQGVK